MTATLGFALLGLLAREPRSGYDLALRMRHPVGLFWRARHSQIYPQLARLQADGLVSHERVEQHDRPDKKIYSITPAGRAALESWVVAPTEVPAHRDELVLKGYSLWLVDPATGVALFRDHERRHREQLAFYESIRDQLQADPATTRLGSPHWSTLAVLQRGIGFEREYAAWCAWIAEQLENAGA